MDIRCTLQRIEMHPEKRKLLIIIMAIMFNLIITNIKEAMRQPAFTALDAPPLLFIGYLFFIQYSDSMRAIRKSVVKRPCRSLHRAKRTNAGSSFPKQLLLPEFL